MSDHTTQFITLDTTKAHQPVKKRAGVKRASVGLHPAVFQIGLGGAIWFLAVSWLYFAWGTHVDLDLAVATGLFVMFFSLLLVMANGIINDPRWLQNRVSFGEFLKSKVATYTGKIRGRDALIEITLIPLSLAFAASIIGLAWVYLR